MEWFIAAGFDAEMIPFYKCGVVNDTIKYWYSFGTKKPILGAGMLTYGLVIEACYLLIMVALWQRVQVNSCYKIMVLLGILDMLAILVNSVTTGYLFLVGATYCTHPNLIYVFGSIGLGLWCGACLLCLILVVNRLCDLWKTNTVEMFFGGWKMTIWLGLPVIYCLYFIFFTPPILFNSSLNAWFFSPMILQTDEEMKMFCNIPHTINNLVVVAMTCFLYVLLCIVLGHKYHFDVMHTMNRIMLQSVLICSASLVASLIYVWMNFFVIPVWVILLGHISWQASHGIPAFVYLILNQTIRRDVLRYLGLQRFIKIESTAARTGTVLSRSVPLHI